MHLTIFARPDRADERELIPTIKVRMSGSSSLPLKLTLPLKLILPLVLNYRSGLLLKLFDRG
jgi:hypothetical protein